VFAFTAPFIAGTIVQNVGYEALFVVAVVMVYCALFVTLRYLRRPVSLAAASG
jgi:dipeptide/tripeptide permease